MSRTIRFWYTDEQIDKWFDSMRAYKEEIHQKYLLSKINDANVESRA